MNTVGQMLALRAKSNSQRFALRDIQEEWDHCDPPYYYEENKRRAEQQAKPEQMFRPRPIDKELDQLKAEVRFLRNKLTEMQTYKQKGNTPF